MARRMFRFFPLYPLIGLLLIVAGMAGCGSEDDEDPFVPQPPPGNRPPVAAAGPDSTAPTGVEFTLDGTASSDPEGDPLTFLWQIVLRPAESNATLSDPTADRPAFTPDVRGEYRFTLVVNDGQADSSPDEVAITAVPPGTNAAPVAVAVPSPGAMVHVGTLVTLDGSGSSDPDGDPLSFDWRIVSQPPASLGTLTGADTPTPSFLPTLAGDYAIELTVGDGRGGVGTATVLVTAVPVGTNLTPIADAGPDRSAIPGTVVQLDGTGSRDPDGDTLRYEWEMISRPDGSFAALSLGTTANPFFTPDVNGDYRFRLTVRDLRNAAASDEVIVTVGPNRAPSADAGVNRVVGVGTLVELDGSASRDPEGETLSFNWTISRPGGSVAVLNGADTATPSFVPDVRGDYVLQLTVSDPQGATGSDSVLISVL